MKRLTAATAANGVLAVVLFASSGDAGAGGRKDGVSAPKPPPPQATGTTSTSTSNGKGGVGSGGTGGRIDMLDGALLAVADTGAPVEPPALNPAEVKRAALDREKTRRERAARLPARAASAPKKE